MDSRKNIGRFIFATTFFFILIAAVFSFFNQQIADFSRSILIMSGDVVPKKVAADQTITDIRSEKKKLDMVKKLDVPISKEAAAKAAKPPHGGRSRTASPPLNGVYFESPEQIDSKAALLLNTKNQVQGNHQTWRGVDDFSAEAFLVKNNSGITFIAKVKDDTVVGDKINNRSEGLRLYFDFREYRNNGILGDGVLILLVNPFFLKEKPATVFLEQLGVKNMNNQIVKDAKVEGEKTEKGYNLKVFIPLSCFDAWKIKIDGDFNFDFNFFDLDRKDKMTDLVWSGTLDDNKDVFFYGRMAKYKKSELPASQPPKP